MWAIWDRDRQAYVARDGYISQWTRGLKHARHFAVRSDAAFCCGEHEVVLEIEQDGGRMWAPVNGQEHLIWKPRRRLSQNSV